MGEKIRETPTKEKAKVARRARKSPAEEDRRGCGNSSRLTRGGGSVLNKTRSRAGLDRYAAECVWGVIKKFREGRKHTQTREGGIERANALRSTTELTEIKVKSGAGSCNSKEEPGNFNQDACEGGADMAAKELPRSSNPHGGKGRTSGPRWGKLDLGWRLR